MRTEKFSASTDFSLIKEVEAVIIRPDGFVEGPRRRIGPKRNNNKKFKKTTKIFLPCQLIQI